MTLRYASQQMTYFTLSLARCARCACQASSEGAWIAKASCARISPEGALAPNGGECGQRAGLLHAFPNADGAVGHYATG